MALQTASCHVRVGFVGVRAKDDNISSLSPMASPFWSMPSWQLARCEARRYEGSILIGGNLSQKYLNNCTKEKRAGRFSSDLEEKSHPAPGENHASTTS